MMLSKFQYFKASGVAASPLKMMRSSTTTMMLIFGSYGMLSLVVSMVLLQQHQHQPHQVWAWVLPKNPSRVPSNCRKHRAVSSLFSTTIEAASSSSSLRSPQDDEASQTSTSSSTVVSMPKIQYTVPGMKIGWKDSTTGLWMDEEGVRNGPPQNYWRQQSDEKLYNDSIEFIQNIILQQEHPNNNDDDDDETTTNFFDKNDVMVNELVRPFEKKNSIRRPFLSRSILGTWVPIVHSSDDKTTANTKIVASSISSTDNDNDDSNNIDSQRPKIAVPYQFQIERTAGRKLGPKTPYGQLDEHLAPDEEITIQAVSSSSSFSADPVRVSAENISKEVTFTTTNNHDETLPPSRFSMGGITYVSKYIMIMRHKNNANDLDFKEESSVTEIWMKI